MTDWAAWTAGYDTWPPLQARLAEVRRQLSLALAACPRGPLHVLSLCAGDGRDVLGALVDHPRRADVTATLVELNGDLVARGEQAVAHLGLAPAVRFHCANATLAASYVGIPPADVLLVAGVFGNLRDAEVVRLIHVLRGLARPQAAVVWTQNIQDDAGEARVARILAGFQAAGFTPHTLARPAPRGFAVGTHIYTGETLSLPAHGRLFEFTGYENLMYPHHRESIANVTAFFENDPEVLALLLGGSLAHGFGTPDSDIDILIVVSDADHAARQRENRLHFFTRDLVTYPEGYVDGKYVSLGFLDLVAQRGSEPARYAFADAQALLSRVDGLDATLRCIARYPVEAKEARLRQFYAQFEAWQWYTGEALKRDNRYLLGVAVSKLVLFGGRLLLAHNEQLYPYHKWFLPVLARVPDRPTDVMDYIERLTADPTPVAIESFYRCVKDFRAWPEPPAGWPTQFMLDSELNWLDGPPPVDDL